MFCYAEDSHIDPAIAEQRLAVASNGNVIVTLKTPYDDGTSHVVLSPMEFMGRL
ncbi:MAG TPA: hypothetical protein EYQ00_10565, partial [Dehalococcoidia bacterium]|nr:hypothetical protein [Dehalococcoidia bacterium]